MLDFAQQWMNLKGNWKLICSRNPIFNYFVKRLWNIIYYIKERYIKCRTLELYVPLGHHICDSDINTLKTLSNIFTACQSSQVKCNKLFRHNSCSCLTPLLIWDTPWIGHYLLWYNTVLNMAFGGGWVPKLMPKIKGGPDMKKVGNHCVIVTYF